MDTPANDPGYQLTAFCPRCGRTYTVEPGTVHNCAVEDLGIRSLSDDALCRIAPDVKLGPGVRIHGFVNLYGCEIGAETRLGCFVEIQKGVKIGARCKISSHTFICEGVTIEDEVFIGHGVQFCNDKHPQACDADGRPVSFELGEVDRILVCHGASIGSGAVILPWVTIGRYAVVGAGAVVTHNVSDFETVAGVPARSLR